jgi:hypothetical protein
VEVMTAIVPVRFRYLQSSICNDVRMNDDHRVLKRGRTLERVTLFWNVAGVVVLAIAAFDAHSVALFGFGLDSLIEIGASIVVLWELADAAMERRRRALQLKLSSVRQAQL